ncbi:hypothetical protein Ae201684_016326 [Aphanomyces euteiches]|uniref:Uncharacterized protein n=1 Tax=Aphanomyces euteiches TaxID=100861 RepID=A0A6G0WCY7_9STRA|nr:hypothetical protein Ae201684_016326 [Aphanomyces euteiches]KAH9138136.1 hypothetical protein AeRB84_017498 [Aphanomyces euteiches]
MEMSEESRRPNTAVPPTPGCTASASFSRWSLVYNVIFVLNLISTPFMAYLNEPRPGLVDAKLIPRWDFFEEYVETTVDFLARHYNNQTVDEYSISRRDIQTNTYGMRRDLTLPFEIPVDNTFYYQVKMPASLFYGQGIRSLVINFLTANKTT